MMIFKLASDLSRYTMLAMVHDIDSSIVRKFHGSPIGDGWRPLEVSPIIDEFEGRTEVGDFTQLYGIEPVFNARAVEVLGDQLRESGELLPLRALHDTYYAYNVTRVVDSLDVDRTRAVWLAPGRILDAQAYAFHPERLRDIAIFKIPQLLGAPVFVTDLFAERLRNSGLTGFALEFLWKDADTSGPSNHAEG